MADNYIIRGNLETINGGGIISDGNVTASAIIKDGGTNLEFLMADGTVSTLSTQVLLYDARYVNTSGDTMNGALTVQSGVLAEYYDLLTTASPAYQMARISWNADKYTINIDSGLDGVSGQVLQELWYPPVTNKSGVDMVNGTIAMVDPSLLVQGERFRIVKADSTYPSKMVLGILTMDIANNQNGIVTKFGEIHDLSYSALVAAGLIDDTEVWAVGNILYLSPTRPGGLTNKAPVAPYNKVACAVIQKFVGNHLDLFVRFEPTFSLNDINDLQIISTPANGDFLRYNLANGRWENSSYSALEAALDDRYVNATGDAMTGPLSVTGNTAGESVLSINGTTGSLLTITDSQTGTIFQVTDISGIPIVQVDSSGYSLQNSGQLIGMTSGTTAVYTLDKYVGSAAYVDYRISNPTTRAFRAGTIMMVWDSLNNVIEHTVVSTKDLTASTTDLIFSVDINVVTDYVRLLATVTNGTWNIKLGVRVI